MILDVDLECLFFKYDACYNSFNSWHTTNIAEHIPSGYSITVVQHHNKPSKTLLSWSRLYCKVMQSIKTYK